MRTLLVVCALAGVAHARPCSTAVRDSEPVRPHATLAEISAERADAPQITDAFPLLDAKQRTAAAARIAAMFPADWNPIVQLDATGMAHVIELELPGKLRVDDLVTPALQFVRAHACLFGIVKPVELTAHAYTNDVIFDRAPHTIGSLSAAVYPGASTTRIRFAGHLWPVADRTVTIEPKRVLKRWLGRTATRRIEMFGPAGTRPGLRFERRATLDLDFGLDPGPILVCDRGHLGVSAAIFVALHAEPDGDAVLAELPAPVDGQGKRITAPWIMPVLVAPDANWTPDDRASPAGRTCLAVPNDP
jgi:hypothetical protein